MHSLLNRQLKRIGAVSEISPSATQWQSFLERVERAYKDADQERYLLERSLMISSREMQETYEQLQKSETRYALAAQGANDGLWDWDLDTEDIYYSPRWMEILGVGPDIDRKMCRNCWLDRIHPSDYSAVLKELTAHLYGESDHFINEHKVLHSDGEYRWVLVRGLAVRDKEGKAVRIAGSMTDITERKVAEEKLAHDALHDSLTGLPNRKRLMERLSRSLERIKIAPDYSFAILFIDLDRFKTINDTMGHQAGDELLLQVTKRLEYTIRPSDMVARLGGDEFVVLVENVKAEDQITPITRRILGELQKPLTVNGQEIFTSASIGIVVGISDYDKADDLVRDADLAMYRAKSKGKSRFELFDAKMHAGALSLLQLEIDLRHAIERGEFTLNYQPVMSLDSEKLVGFEALIRWNHPIRGFVPPDEFISVAEKTGLILPIGKWVLREACRQMREWQDTFPDTADLIINVNISACELEQKNLVSRVRQILNETGLAAECLKLEITETVIMSNAEQVIKTVGKLRKMGVRVSIDDFGTGYSSLSYLHRLPIDTLKIDRSFIDCIGREDEHTEIVRTIIKLACSLGMDVVAEGIESENQLDFLKEISCDYGQGYYYSKPVTSAVAEEMFQKLPGATLLPEKNTRSRLNDPLGR
ncbi:MAG: EAL domain-containing protein [Pyrinomonadaceae bacterium]